MTTQSKTDDDSTKLSRRTLLKAIPALTFSPSLFAQSALPIAVRKLHSFGMHVRNVETSLGFYQQLFAAEIQARQGDTVCLRIGDGPKFFSLSPVTAGQQPGFSHIGLSVENFELESVRNQLDNFGIARRSQAGPKQASLEVAMQSWVQTRRLPQGGSASGTEELYFADVEGLIYQLAGTDHCGGAGALGAVCEGFESSSAVGMFKLLDLSHFTNFVVNSARANEFCTRIFGLGFQAYQGPTSPIVGVGDGKQFLMYVEGGEAAASTPPGRVDHVCLSIENFDVEAVISKLENCGISARENANITPPLVHWTSMRMPNRGGVEGGTPEVYFSDPDGIRVQLQHASYCGGGGYFGDDCSAHN